MSDTIKIGRKPNSVTAGNLRFPCDPSLAMLTYYATYDSFFAKGGVAGEP